MKVTENISEFIRISKSKTGKDSFIVLAGSVFSSGLGFLATILITRTLGPAQFGVFSVSLAVMLITAQFSDFGIRTSLVRFVSLFLKDDESKANLTLKVALKFKLIAALLIFLIGIFLSKSLAIHVFEKPILTFPLKLAFVGAFGMSLVSYIAATLQARQSFKKLALLNLINPLGKFILIGLLFLSCKLDLFSAFTTVATLPFIAFLIGSLIIPKAFLKAKGEERKSFYELFHYSKWVLVSVFCVMLFNKLDVLMLGYFKTTEIIGYYSAAYAFAFIFPLITGAVTTVLLPKFSGVSSKSQLRKYTVKSLRFTAPIIFPLIILLLASKPIILWFYGVEYLSSAIIFKVLICAFAISVIINPISLAIYSLNRPEIVAYLNIVQLILNFLGNIFLIPLYGAVGAASVTLLIRVVAIVYIGSYIYINVIRRKAL